MSTFVDLSHTLKPGMPTYPGIPPMQFHTVITHEESLERGTYAPGTTFQMTWYEIAGNTGTYIDAPFHRHPQGVDLAGVPLEKTANLPGIVVPLLQEGPLKPEQFQGYDLAGKAVLIRTDWSQRWGSHDYFRSGPFLPAETCRYLIEAGAVLVGIDCANIDDMADKTRPAHTLLLEAGIPIVEHLCSLERLPATPFRFFAVSLAIQGGTSFSVRAFALCE